MTMRNAPRASRLFSVRVPLALFVFVSLFPVAAIGATTGPVEIEIARVNGTWTDLDAGLQPIEQGPVTIVVRVPEHALTVHENRLRLAWADREAGTVDVEFEARLEGWGNLELEMRTATGTTPYEDRVLAKTQWVKAGAVVRLSKVEGAEEVGGEGTGNYRLEVVRSHRPIVGIQIESDLAQRLVATCRGLRAFPMFAAVDCDALSASLARVEAPMPEPGDVYFLPASLFTSEERAVIDSFSVAPTAP